jgi:RNA polymerase sigma factor (sigma-70 family)
MNPYTSFRLAQTRVAGRRREAAARRPPADARALDGLIAAAARGDEHAWSLVRDRYAGRIETVARLHRLSAHDVEDVVQTTWLRLLEHIGGLRDPAAVGAWLETTARRESLRLVRAGRRERPTDDTTLEDRAVAPPADEPGPGRDRAALVAEAIGSLPARQRALITTLVDDPPPSYATVSVRLGIPVGSIGPTRARSLERLRRDRRIATLLADA